MTKEAITLTMESPPIKYLCEKDTKLKIVIERIGPITYKPFDNPYSFLIHEIIEQMLSKKAGQKIYDRLATLCDGDVTPLKVSSLSYEQIKSIGTANSKVGYIQSVTASILNNEIDLDSLPYKSDEEVYKELTKLKGIGSWTAKMYLIFVLDRQDILPTEDGAFLQSYKWLYNARKLNKSTIERNCKKWKPYSSIASRYLYKALDGGLTKENLRELTL